MGTAKPPGGESTAPEEQLSGNVFLLLRINMTPIHFVNDTTRHLQQGDLASCSQLSMLTSFNRAGHTWIHKTGKFCLLSPSFFPLPTHFSPSLFFHLSHLSPFSSQFTPSLFTPHFSLSLSLFTPSH